MLPEEAGSDGFCVVAFCEIPQFDGTMFQKISGSIGRDLGRSTVIACLAPEQSEPVIGLESMSELPEKKNPRTRHGSRELRGGFKEALRQFQGIFIQKYCEHSRGVIFDFKKFIQLVERSVYLKNQMDICKKFKDDFLFGSELSVNFSAVL